MDKKGILKDKELTVATDHMNRLVNQVKYLTREVKKGRGTPTVLNRKIAQLEGIQNKVKILSAESKMFGQWKTVEEKLPTNKELYLWITLLSLSILYLAKNS